MDYLYIIIGIILLILSGNYLVKSSSNLAKYFKIPPIIIGVTIVSFGTSAPELFVSASASLNGLSDVAIGNAIGSNIANLGLVLGLSALIVAVPIKKSLIKLDYSVLMFSAILFGVLALDYKITRLDGAILILAMLIYIFIIIRLLKKNKIETAETEEESQQKIYHPFVSLLIIIASCGGLVFGSDFLVDGAVSLATKMGVSERIISLTVVAIGTSLPELTTSVIAAIKRNFDISIGNVVGSNIFNTLFIVGTSACINPLTVNPSTLKIDYPAMLIFYVLLGVFFLPVKRLRISRFEGLILIIAYVIYSYIIFS
ncbi:MAG: calcium/sodium antiporter [Bacteroidota bacterium]|jgi:cation:H+ antiporter|nr:calcium/sodium antiporter [Bacteroidales bacterium]MDI9534473.1 calcium/sodium antiporter [Bacteroidota bacterium]OQC45502.1 MAG: Inner membrane protein YrbG [Bacteroidetes bacterium ADurb.Bin028]NLP20714.1 calcium/sodium antiporter [Bacteroidales bacterium]HNY44134.1 calcium/sodium antiporter [Bacteroidales bacterium]